MPCVSTIPPKLSDRTIGSTTACLSLSFLPPPIFPLALTSLSHSLSLTLTLYLSVSLRVLLRSWEYTEAIRNSIRSPWRDTAVYWTGPRHGGASHFLPREILVEEKRRRLSWPRFASMDSQRNHQGRENWFFLFFFFYSPSLLSPPSPFLPCYLRRTMILVRSTILELRSLLIITLNLLYEPEADDLSL